MDPSSPSFTNLFFPSTTDCPLPGDGEVTPSSSPHYLILIAVCCSTLAAVVVGVVAYLVFKRSVGRMGGGGCSAVKNTKHNWVLHFNNNIIRDRAGTAMSCLRLNYGSLFFFPFFFPKLGFSRDYSHYPVRIFYMEKSQRTRAKMAASHSHGGLG